MMDTTDCRNGSNLAMNDRAFWVAADEDWTGLAVGRGRRPATASKQAQDTDHLRRLGELLPEVLERYAVRAHSPLAKPIRAVPLGT